MSTAAFAVKVTDHLDLGGAIRARVDSNSSRDIQKIGFDTIILNAQYDSDSWLGAASYRFYGKEYPYQYTAHFGDVSFAECAWVGYRFDEAQHVEVGLNKLPFGLQPQFESSFTQGLGNVLGLEDIDQVGIKYERDADNTNLQLGYYVRPAWAGHGTSNGTSNGSTYSIVVTPADAGVVGGSQNVERNLFAARLAQKINLGAWEGEVGASAFTSTLHNRDTQHDGRRAAYGLHYGANRGPWGVKLQFARQMMSPKNPGSSQTISFGGFDGTFNVASRGNLYAVDTSYSIPGMFAGGWLSDIKVYGGYSLFQKSVARFRDSQRFILGTSFSVKSLKIYAEWLNGRNDPSIGGGGAQSLAVGDINTWKNQFYVNVGYYF